jgi:hypothetical protein
MSGEVVVIEVVVADSVVEQEDGEVVVPLVGSGVGLEDEQEAVGSVLEGRVLEVAVPNCGGGFAVRDPRVNDLDLAYEEKLDLQGPDPAGFSFGMPPAKRPPS